MDEPVPVWVRVEVDVGERDLRVRLSIRDRVAVDVGGEADLEGREREAVVAEKVKEVDNVRDKVCDGGLGVRLIVTDTLTVAVEVRLLMKDGDRRRDPENERERVLDML